MAHRVLDIVNEKGLHARASARFVEVVRVPIAVRSSSLLEDSQHQPFTGVYVTHNLAEAVRLGHRIAVLSRRPGRVREVIEKYGHHGGLIISPTHVLEPEVPLENIDMGIQFKGPADHLENLGIAAIHGAGAFPVLPLGIFLLGHFLELAED